MYKYSEIASPFIVAVWKSFGAKGLGCLAKCDAVTLENFNAVWKAIEKTLGIDFDDKTKVASKINVISYDEDIRVNLSATSFDYHEPEHGTVTNSSKLLIPDYVVSSTGMVFENEKVQYGSISYKPKNYVYDYTALSEFDPYNTRIKYKTEVQEDLFEGNPYKVFDPPLLVYKINSFFMIKEGGRNNLMLLQATKLLLLNPDADRGELLARLFLINRKQCNPPLPGNELVMLFKSRCKKMDEGSLHIKPESKTVAFSKKCLWTTEEKRIVTAQEINKLRNKSTIDCIASIIEIMKSENKKIKQVDVISRIDKCTRTVKSKWVYFKANVKIYNDSLEKK